MSIWWRNKRVFISISFELVKNFLDHSLNREKERKKADCLFEAIYESIFMPTCDNRCAHGDDFCFLSSLFVYWHCECDVCASVFASSAAYFFVIISFYWERQSCVSAHFKFISFLDVAVILYFHLVWSVEKRREQETKTCYTSTEHRMWVSVWVSVLTIFFFVFFSNKANTQNTSCQNDCNYLCRYIWHRV